MNQMPIIVILGPTAVGKTEIAIDLALKLDAEIISADSMQIYRYMNVGTAKPTIEERLGVPHHMIDIINPNEDFNVSMYKEMALDCMKKISKAHKPIMLVGGTGLYISSLIDPTMTFTEAGVDQDYRRKLENQLKLKGNKWLHERLIEVDYKTGMKLHPNDTRRIIRALEIYHLTGKPLSLHRQEEPTAPSISMPILIGLNMNRSKLYDRINRRVDRMIEDGLVEEVQSLIENGYSAELNSMKGLGYKEIIQYLRGYRTLEESIYILKRDTRRFAKRQLTWFSRLTNVYWVDVERYENKRDIGNQLLDHIKSNTK